MVCVWCVCTRVCMCVCVCVCEASARCWCRIASFRKIAPTKAQEQGQGQSLRRNIGDEKAEGCMRRGGRVVFGRGGEGGGYHLGDSRLGVHHLARYAPCSRRGLSGDNLRERPNAPERPRTAPNAPERPRNKHRGRRIHSPEVASDRCHRIPSRPIASWLGSWVEGPVQHTYSIAGGNHERIHGGEVDP